MSQRRFQRVTGRLLRAWNARHAEATVLCADDDENIRALCVAAVARAGYVAEIAADGREALQKIRRRRYAAILLDLGLPYLHGATLVSVIAKEQPEILPRVIVITAAPEAVLVDLEGHVSAILRKPIGFERLLEAISKCCGGDATVRRRPATT